MSRSSAPAGVPVRPQRIKLPAFGDGRGKLTVVESAAEVGFEIKRVYWITEVPAEAQRGGHAHRRVIELLVAIAGSFVVRCTYGGGSAEFDLRAGGDALLLPSLVWREVERFSRGAICLVLASGPYDEDEYVHDPDELRALAGRG